MALPIAAVLLNYARRLRFPVLFGITAVLFVVNLLVPDPLPLLDELLLGLGTLLLASLRRRPQSRAADVSGTDETDRQP